MMKYLKFLPFYLLSIFPLRFLYIVSDFTFFFIYYLVKYRRKVVNSNMERSFPDKTKVERVRIEKKFYRHFCDVFFETIKCLTISKGEIFKRFKVKDIEMVEEYYQQEKNIIIYTAHFGNWEWFGFLPLFLPHQCTAFYQKLSSNYFNHLMQIIRSRYGIICMESSNAYRGLVNLEKDNKFTFNCIIGDQSPGVKTSKHWVKFLHQDTAFLVGPDRIAKKLNYVVIFSTFKKFKRGKYELRFSLIARNPKEIESSELIASYSKKLEESIFTSPEMWLWTHNRWKLTRPDTT
ncbi:MAG: hypothetical protein GKR88_20830 [Flavobacteriaceae bacterium]|nr:MAG: hypothetical protein GKR88_20830 [Flavobacteriaceae bacterium]